MCGLGGEIAQAINELAFDELDAPVGRLHTASVSHPFAPDLERAVLVDTGCITAAAKAVIAGRPPISDHWFAPGISGANPAASPARPVRDAGTGVSPDAPDATSVSTNGRPILMPFGDLTVSEGKLIGWLKEEGDPVAAGEIVAEIETDKTVVEIPAASPGLLGPHEVQVGDMVPMGGRIGSIL